MAMLPRERRLTSNHEFKRVRRSGRKVATPFFDLYYLQVGEAPSRFGFVVSTKLDKRAVKRNRIKRIFREEVRLLLSGVKAGFDLIFWVKRQSLEAETEQVRTTLRSALKKSGLLIDG